jgi:hypothetical protein
MMYTIPPAEIRRQVEATLADPSIALEEKWLVMAVLSLNSTTLPPPLKCLDELIALSETLHRYRGRGSQSATRNVRNLLFWAACELTGQSLTSSDGPVAPDPLALEGLKKLAVVGQHFIAENSAASDLASQRKADGYGILAECSGFLPLPEVWTAVCATIVNNKARRPERIAAIEFIENFANSNDDPLPEVLVKCLETAAKTTKDRSVARAALIVLVDVGEVGELAAMDVLEALDD